MSVPAFKNSRSKVRRRRSHHALKPITIVIDKKTGEPRLPHHASQVDTSKKAIEKTVEKAVAPAKKASEKPKAAKKETKTSPASKTEEASA